MNLLPGADAQDVAVGGVRFRLHRSGAASGSPATTPTLLLHGVPQTAAIWRELLPALAVDRVVLAPDLKGLGASEVAAPYDVPTLVRELAALILHEVDGPVDVVGHDWGGSLAIALAGARPDLVRRLVVISAPFRKIDFRRAPHLLLFALPVLPELLFGLGGRDLVRRLIGYAWVAQPALPRAVGEHYAAAYADPARVEAMLGYYRAAMRGKVAEGLRRGVRAAMLRDRGAGPPPAIASAGASRAAPEPALVLWGAADPVLPLPVGEAVVRDLGPGTRFVTLPGVGHFPLEEAPEVAVPAIAEFLRAG